MNFLHKIIKYCVLALLIFLIRGGTIPCYASLKEESRTDGSTTDSESEKEQIEQDLLDDLELEEVDRMLEEITGHQISMTDMMREMVKGGQALKWSDWSELAAEALQESLGIRKRTWIQILLLVLFSTILTNLVSVFENQQLGDTSFYIIYLILFAILLKSFGEFSEQISQTLFKMTEFMKALLPSYYLALTASVGVSTASVFYQSVIFLIYIAEKILLIIILPGIRIYLLVALINELTGEQFLSKMTELLEDGIQWVLKTLVGVVMGMELLKRLVSPAVDALRQTMIGKTAGAIPGLGNIFSGITEMVLGSAILIKNCLGAVTVIILLLMAISPVIKLGASALFYQIAAACIQPIADKRMVNCLHAMGKSIGMLLKLLLTLELLFLLTIAILAGSLR